MSRRRRRGRGLSYKVYDVPFGGGIDTKTQDQVLQAPKMASVEDMHTQKTGALVRRSDYATRGTPDSDVQKVFEYEDTLVALSKDGAFRLKDDTDGTSKWTTLQTPGPRGVDFERRAVVRSEESAALAFSASHQGYTCHVWSRGTEEDPEVWIRVDDATTDVTIYGPLKMVDMTCSPDTGVTDDMRSVYNSGLQVVPFTNSGNPCFAVVCTAQDPKTSIILSVTMLSVNTTTGVVTSGSPVLQTGLPAPGAYAMSDKDATTFYIVTGYTTPGQYSQLHRMEVLTSLSVTVESTANLTLCDIHIGGMVHVAGDYVHVYGEKEVEGDDPPEPEVLSYWQTDANVTLPASITGATLYSAASDEVYHREWATGVERPDGTAVCIYAGLPQGDQAPPSLQWVEIDAAGAPGYGADRIIFNKWILAEPFSDSDGRVILPLVSTYHEEPLTDSTLRFDSRQHALLAEIPDTSSTEARRIAALQIDVARAFHVGQTVDRAGGYMARIPRTDPIEDGGALGFTSLTNEIGLEKNVAFTLIELDTHIGDGYANGVRTLSAGYLSQVDGYRHAEVLQIQPPQMVHQDFLYYQADPPDHGADIELERYGLRFVWMWRDTQGNIHRSAPSDVYYNKVERTGSVATTFTDRYQYLSARFVIPTFMDEESYDGDLPTDVFLEAYHVSITDPAIDTMYAAYMYFAEPATVPAYDRIPIRALRDPSQPWMSLEITTSPNQALAGSPNGVGLYTNTTGSGPLPHDPTPCPLHIATTKERVWLLDSENRNKVWPSAPIREGSMPEFSATNPLLLPNEAGDLTALGAVGDLVVFFGKKSIHALESIGGPDREGRGTFAPIRSVSREIGCVNRASVVTTDIGIMFESEYGICAITRAQQVMRDLGRDSHKTFQALRSAGSTIVAATAIPGSSHVAFDFSDGTTLLFDYEHGQWTTYNHGTVAAPVALASGCALKGKHVVVRGDEAFMSDDAVASERVTCSFTTGWMRLAGVQGYQRIRRVGLLGRVLGDETLPALPYGSAVYAGQITLRVYYDDNETDFFDYAPRSCATLHEDGHLNPLQIRWHLHDRQSSMSMKFRVTYDFSVDDQETAYPLKPEFSGLALEVGVERDINRISQTRGEA